MRVAELSRAVASLRIFGDGLVPHEVSALLGAEPATAHAKGEVIASTHGSPRVARTGSWIWSPTETSPADIDAQVAELVRHLTPDLTVWEWLADRFDVDFFCGWFMRRENEGVAIAPETLTALGDRRILLDLDIYGTTCVEASGT